MPFSIDDTVKNEFDNVLGTVVDVDGYAFTVRWDDEVVTYEKDDSNNLVSLATPACECGNPFSLCHPEA